MADSSLQAIQTKVRRLTRSPSEAQLTTDELNQYINTAVLYDFSEHIRLFNFHTTLTFYTEPNVDTYDPMAITNPSDPLYDFLNRYISIDKPIYIAGYDSMYTQSREYFYGIYPFLNNFSSTNNSGDGVTTHFEGTLSAVPVLQNNVIFNSIDANNNGLVLKDVPQSAEIGNLYIPNDLSINYGMVNYITGAFSFDFPTPPAMGAQVSSQTVPYNASLPRAMLYYDNKFVLRPVPDQVYAINFQAYRRPTELLATNQNMELNELWQYIAFLSAKKIFEDRMDMDSVQLIMPELNKQERLCLRRTLVQQSTQRTYTIYATQTNPINNWWGGYWGAGSQF